MLTTSDDFSKKNLAIFSEIEKSSIFDILKVENFDREPNWKKG